ncbi:MAG TPA: helix-turn-helix domain-containing protein [Methylomirabilota bacterium]
MTAADEALATIELALKTLGHRERRDVLKQAAKNVLPPLLAPGFGRRKLLDHDIVQIVSDYTRGRATQSELATRYGVSQSCISLIVRGRRQGGTGFKLIEAKKNHAAQVD